MERIILNNTSIFRVQDSVVLGNVSCPVVKGPLSAVDLVTTNGYRYKNTFWKRVINHDSVQERVSNREMLGMIEHPEDDEEYLRTPYKKASHVVLGVSIENMIPIGTFGLLNNPEGNSMKALADLGVPLGVSTRGLGDFLEDEVSQYVDENNYICITWDFTNNPNIKQSKMIISKVSDSMRSNPLYSELLDMYQIRDSGTYARIEALSSNIYKLVEELKTEISKINQR